MSTPEDISKSPIEFELLEAVASEVLSPEQAEELMKTILARKTEALANENVRNTQLDIASLAIAAHQNSSSNIPDNLNVIGWERFTRNCSFDILDLKRELGADQAGLVPDSVTKFAACYVGFRELFSGEQYDEVEATLTGTGYTLKTVHETFVQTYKILERQTLVTHLGDDSDMLRFLDWPSDVFNYLETEMRKELIETGYKLPELAADGSYGLKEGCNGGYSDHYLVPEPNESMLP